MLKVRDMLEKFFTVGSFEIPKDYTSEEFKEYRKLLEALRIVEVKHREIFDGENFIIKKWRWLNARLNL